MIFRELVQSGPPTVAVISGDWHAVVDVQARLMEAHPDQTFVHLRGKKMRTAPAFFDEVAAALQLPVWFGANWDALIDVVRDRGWLAGVVIAVYDAQELLADAGERDCRNCADVLELFNRYGKDCPPDSVDPDDTDGFHLLALVPPAHESAFIERWRPLGLTVALFDPT